MRKEVQPPFRPPVSSDETDTVNFDKTFTKMAPNLSPPSASPLNKALGKEKSKAAAVAGHSGSGVDFEDFSYVYENEESYLLNADDPFEST